MMIHLALIDIMHAWFRGWGLKLV